MRTTCSIQCIFGFPVNFRYSRYIMYSNNVYNTQTTVSIGDDVY